MIGVGGFLGIGEKDVAMKLDRLEMTQDTKSGGLQLTMDVNKDELAHAVLQVKARSGNRAASV